MCLFKTLILVLCFSGHYFHESYNTYRGGATVHPVDPFDPVSDAARLRKAMEGWGTDEQEIIDVLTKRSLQQRLVIEKTFKEKYAKDLVPELHSELSGDFRHTILSMMSPLVQLYAKELRKAMNRVGADEEALIEILTTLPTDGVKSVTKMYEQIHGRDLEADVHEKTSGDLRKLLVALCQANRNTSDHVNVTLAVQDANDLFYAGEGTEAQVFTNVLVNRSYPQLRQTFVEYQKFAGEDIEDTITKVFSKSLRKGFLAIVRHVKSPLDYFAERLYDSMEGLGTKDNTLIRIIVSRSEIDLAYIRNVFDNKNAKTLVTWVDDETSGDYRKTLLALIG